MKVEDLPEPLQAWLLELEGFHLRVERLYEEARADPPMRLLAWLDVAYRIGVAQGPRRLQERCG